MLTLEQCLDLGVLITEEQTDFFHHPEGKLAVVVYGVPDPVRLYNAGLDYEGTMYQVAPEGVPADEDGYAACVLPVIMLGDNQEELLRAVEYWDGELDDAELPVVYGWPQAADFMAAWSHDEVPIGAAPWDLWPITAEDVQPWANAADNAYWSSAIQFMFEYMSTMQGSEYYGEEEEDLQHAYFEISNQLYKREQEYQGRPEQDAEIARLAVAKAEANRKMHEAADAYIAKLEARFTHPVTGEADARLPPVNLPTEQAAIWRSLQSLSWRNWAMLNKQLGDGSAALHGGRFAEANRRLCPWY